MAGNLRRVVGNAGWLLGGKGVGAVLSLFYLALATRTLGLADFGRFALVVAIGQAVAGIVGFQTWQFVIRYGMAAARQGDTARVERITAFAAMLDVVSAVAGTGVAAAAIILLGPLLGLPPALNVPALGFCAATLLAIRSTPVGLLRLDDRFRDGAVAESMTPVTRAVGAGAAALLSPDVTGFLVAWAVAELVTAAAYWRLALRDRRLVLSLAGLRRTRREEDRIWRFVMATNAQSALASTSRQVTLIAVGLVAGPAATGAFRLAAQLAQALAKLTQSLSRAAYPELVRSLGDAGGANERRLLGRLTLLAAGAGAVTIGVAAVAGEPLLRLIAGQPVTEAVPAMLVLVAAAAIDLSGVAFEPALTARGRAGLALGLRAAATVVQWSLLIVLLPVLGAIGAGWATLGGSVVLFGLTAWSVFRR